MSAAAERQVSAFLGGLRRLSRQVGLYPEGHPATQEAVELLGEAVQEFLDGEPEVTLTIFQEAFFRNRVVVPHASLEYRSLLQEMEQRGLETITLVPPISAADLFDLAAFVGGVSDDLPADGTIVLNEPMTVDPELDPTPASKLRTSYGNVLDAIRHASSAMVVRGSFELGTVVDAVEGLFEHTLSHPGAALLLSTVKSHDEYTFFHSVNVCILSLAVGQMIGVDRDVLVPAGVGAVLHDIGKVAVSPEILNYPGRLSAEQWKEIEIHPQEGALAILAAGGEGSEIAANVAFEHHARFDGEGYPRVSRVRRPHVYSRLVQVVDTYDAITSRRAYRRAEGPSRALQILLDGAGSYWDPDLVRAFIQMMGVYPPGSILRVDDGAIAVVVSRTEEPGAPLSVVTVVGPDGCHLDEPEPTILPLDRVVRQELPDDVGVDPASLLETIEGGLRV